MLDCLSVKAVGRLVNEPAESVTREIERLLTRGPEGRPSTPVDMRAKKERKEF